MNKLVKMIVIGVSMVGTCFGSTCTPDEVVETARVYKVQLNAYTTKGVANASITSSGSACVPGNSTCVVNRGKDKTIFRGYLYICTPTCGLSDYSCVLVDRRGVEPCVNSEAEFNILNYIGVNTTDVECAFNLDFETVFDSQRSQEISLNCCGYGIAREGMISSAKGYFTGTGTASFDLTSKAECVCSPSQVITCDSCDSNDYKDSDTVFFGMWKIQYDESASKAYTSGKFSPDVAIKRLISK